MESWLLNEANKHVLLVDVENVGERLLRPFVWAELYDSEGMVVGTFEGDRFRTYPGTSVRYRIDVSDVPEGSYKALVVADCGEEDAFGIQYSITID